MALYAIADLHLSTNSVTNKSMEVFGNRWTGYTDKLINNWNRLVTDEDTVVLPGDISWALTLTEALCDFQFIAKLKGTKLIGKGNHDFWWASLTKMNSFLADNQIDNIKFLHNNAFAVDEYIICGTRGWFYDEKQSGIPENTDYNKLVNREVQRLALSLEAGERLSQKTGYPILVFLHFPPVWGNFVCKEILDLLKNYRIKRCFFGHIHGGYDTPPAFNFEGIDFRLISADHLNFTPLYIPR
ncbi:MAG: serine/threonine protein phosphatase [Clostridiales bacterium]|nr:serine/threonine protein phosphatase [Clostridiales bacterium]